MKKHIVIILISVFVIVPVFAQQFGRQYDTEQPRVRFATLPVYIDSGNRGLAAYQFELKALSGQIKIVGVENGEHPAFVDAPYYDPAAMANDRIIIAAFNTGDDLPTGRTRITTIHLQIIGDVEPEYQLELNVAGDENGREISAEITCEKEI
jgi:hypothetical protein